MTRGMTLMETVVTIGISIVALLALVNLFLIFNSIYGYQRTFMAAAGSAGAAMNALEASILPAERVLASYDFAGTTYASSADTLVLELPAFDDSGDIVSGAKDYVAFYVSAGTLYRLVEADVQSMRHSGRTQLSTVLDALSFTYDTAEVTNATNIIVDIETQAQFKQQTVHSRLREQLYLRNAHSLP